MARHKKWYESKGEVGGLIVIIGGILLLIGQLVQGDLNYQNFFGGVIPLIGTGLGIFGIRNAL